MEFGITLAKMPTYQEDEVHYILKADNDFIKVNDLIGREVLIEFLDQKFCSGCGDQYQELFRMGFCRNCFFTRPEAGESIIRPELSRAHEGEEDRDLAFEKDYQLQPHVVYLANTAGIKVGVTRQRAKLNRWMDQGASEAIVFAETTNRYEAGLIEVALKEYVADKTAWQRMLKNEVPEVDLKKSKAELSEKLEGNLRKFVSSDNTCYHFKYPVKQYPGKVKGVNLDKEKKIQANLQGIKGQYLIFEGGAVLNVRANTGYRVSFSFS